MKRLRSVITAALLALSACGGAYADAIARGDKFAEAAQWDEAAAAYEAAIRIDPNDPEAKIKLAEIRKRQAAERLSRAEALEQRGELAAALALVQEAVSLDADSAEAQRALTRITDAVLARAAELKGQDKLREAFELTQQVLAGSPHHPRAKKLDGELRDALAERAYQRAVDYAERDKNGNALVELAACLTYRPDFPDAKLQFGQVKLRLEQALRFTVVLDPFKGGGGAGEVAKAVKPELLKQAIDERLLLEIVTQAPTGDAVHGVHLAGELKDYDFHRDKKTIQRSCDYVCGTTYKPNPEIQRLRDDVARAEQELSRYDDEISRKERDLLSAEKDLARDEEDAMKKQADVDQARQRLDDCRAKSQPNNSSPCSSEESNLRSKQSYLDSARRNVESRRGNVTRVREDIGRVKSSRDSARQSRDSKQQELLRTPEQIAVDKYCPHSYAVEQHATGAKIVLALTMDQLGEAKAIVAGQPFAYDAAATDESFAAQAGRCPEIAAGNPLELPSEQELRKELTTKIIKDLRTKVLASYDAYRRGFLSAARRHEAAGLTEDATEAYVRYVLTGPHQLEEADKLGAFFQKTRGIGKLDALWRL